MIAQGIIDLYVVDGDALGRDLSKLLFCVDYTELPDIYTIHQVLILAFDFAPLKAWTAYKAVANQNSVFNASEWIEDHASPYALAIEAAQKDGALARALADGKIIITYAPDPKPTTPDIYDIWETTADLVSIEDLSAYDAEAFALSGSDKVYYYFGLDDAWHLCTEAMRSSIEESIATYNVKSQASVWNVVNVSGTPYINGWQSIIEYQNNHLLKNDFAIIADNFYIGAVGNVVQTGIDSTGKPIYESTGEAYKPFSVDTVNHTIKFDGIVDFTNTNTYGTTTIDGGKITTNSISSSTIGAQQIKTVNLETGIQILNGYIASSDFMSIGGSGFRLKSNAAGTSVDPTIYGAYIKGSIVDADSIISGSLSVNYVDTYGQYIDNNSAQVVLITRSYDNSMGVSNLVVANFSMVQTEGGTLGTTNTILFELLENDVVVEDGSLSLQQGSGLTARNKIIFATPASNATYKLKCYSGGAFGCTISGTISFMYFKK